MIKCEYCKFWRVTIHTAEGQPFLGVCFRYPPAFSPSDVSPQMMGVEMHTRASCMCGEGRPKEGRE